MQQSAVPGDRQHDLVAEEGVAEGSAASTVEDESSGSHGVAGAGVASAGVEGPGGSGVPAAEEHPAPPVGDVSAQGDGQQQQVGEG